MTSEDLRLSVQRHATSKLRTLDDLEKILTLGFRGEALPSVSAVSDLQISPAPKAMERSMSLRAALPEWRARKTISRKSLSAIF